MIVSALNSKDIAIWDYDVLRLYEVIEFESEISCVFMTPDYNIFVVAHTSGELNIFKYFKQDSKIEIILIESLKRSKWIKN